MYVLVTDNNRRIIKYPKDSKDGEVVFSTGEWFSKFDIDGNNNIYYPETNNHRVVKYNLDTKNSEVVAGGNGWGSEPNQLKDSIR